MKLVFVTLRMTLTHAAFCHGHWGLIIVSGFPESSAGVAWKERSCMQTAKESLIASLNSFGSDFYVWKCVSFKDPSEIHISQTDRTCNTVMQEVEHTGRLEINAVVPLWRIRRATEESVQASERRLRKFLREHYLVSPNLKSKIWLSLITRASVIVVLVFCFVFILTTVLKIWSSPPVASLKSRK